MRIAIVLGIPLLLFLIGLFFMYHVLAGANMLGG